jgi:T5orf172 domain
MNRKPDTVYVMRAASGHYKVGCSSLIDVRLRQIRRSSPVNVELVCSMPGTVEVERRLHTHLAASRMHCEWFADSPEIHEVIRWIEAGDPYSPFTAQYRPEAA